ncbi:MAG: cobalamin biosynthesis protein CobD [Elusimicrobia bacterium]|nr:cobalamin biosynthesis protein CobD [Elusimicrobiota bacterium]
MSLVPSLTAGYALDTLLGDPQWVPHPIRWIGFLIEKGEKIVRRIFSSETVAGTLLTVTLVASSFLVCKIILGIASGYSWILASLLETTLIYFCLSTKDLALESSWVKNALIAKDLDLARKKLSWIVGRDTSRMEEKEIVRGAVETIAENTVDGIIAPLLYAVLGGAPLALAYKTVNTLDSMIGHRDERYAQFGRFAAHLDRWMNWVPARISGLLFPLASFLSGHSFRDSFQSAWSAPQTNTTIPEGAMAGALGVELGGLNYYKGMPALTPTLGVGKVELSIQNIGQSVRIMWISSILFFLFVLSLRLGMERIFS